VKLVVAINLTILAITFSAYAGLQPVGIEMVYHHFPTEAHKAEFRSNLEVIFKKLSCETTLGDGLTSFERANNITTYSLGLKGTVGCKISYCEKSSAPSKLELTFYDTGTVSGSTMAHFELKQCGSVYRTNYRFSGSKLIGLWSNTAPDSETYGWQKDPGTSTDSFYNFEGTKVHKLEIKH
jgi:hypothetical protein